MWKFGGWLARALRGGVVLAPAEQWLLQELVAALPPHLRPTVESQLRCYNLAQREVDGRAINFYARPASRFSAPLLPMSAAPAVLVRVKASSGAAEPVHATLTAVSGQVFCMAISRCVQSLPAASLELAGITEAWRSNFPAGAPNNSSKPTPLRGAA